MFSIKDCHYKSNVFECLTLQLQVITLVQYLAVLTISLYCVYCVCSVSISDCNLCCVNKCDWTFIHSSPEFSFNHCEWHRANVTLKTSRVYDTTRVHRWLCPRCSSKWRGRNLHSVSRRQRGETLPCHRPILHELQS